MTRMGMMSRFEAARIRADTYRFNRNRRRFSLAKGSYEFARGQIPSSAATESAFVANNEGQEEGDSSFADLVTTAENRGRLSRYIEGELGFMLTDEAIERAREIAEIQTTQDIDLSEFEPEEVEEMKDDPFGPFAFLESYEAGMNPPPRDPSQPRPPIGMGPLDELRDAAEVFLFDIGEQRDQFGGPRTRFEGLNAGDYVLVDYDGTGGYLPIQVVFLILDEGFNVSAGVIDPDRREEVRERQFRRRLDFENFNREDAVEGRGPFYYPEEVGQVVTL